MEVDDQTERGARGLVCSSCENARNRRGTVLDRRREGRDSSARKRRVWLGGILLAAVSCSTPPTPPASPATVETQRAEMARSLLETGRGLAAHGDALRAEQYFRAALASGAPPEDVLPALIAVCIQSQRYRAAVADARNFLSEHPNASHLRFLLASLLAGLGDFPAAVDELGRVVSAQPDNALAHYALAVLYRDRLHRLEQADQAFRAYLRLAPTGPHAQAARAFLLQPVHDPEVSEQPVHDPEARLQPSLDTSQQPSHDPESSQQPVHPD